MEFFSDTFIRVSWKLVSLFSGSFFFAITFQHRHVLSFLPPVKDNTCRNRNEKPGIFLSYPMKVCLHTCIGAHTDCECTHRQQWLSHHLPQDWMVLVQDLNCSFPLCDTPEMISYLLPKFFNWKITFTYATVSSNMQAIPSSQTRSPSTQATDYFLLCCSTVIQSWQHTFNLSAWIYFIGISIRAWRRLCFPPLFDFYIREERNDLKRGHSRRRGTNTVIVCTEHK